MEEALRLIRSGSKNDIIDKLYTIDFSSLKDDEKKEIYRIAVSRNGELLKEVPDELVTQEICNAAVDDYPDAILDVPPPFLNERLCYHAIVEDIKDWGNWTIEKILAKDLPINKYRLCMNVLRFNGSQYVAMDNYLPTLTQEQQTELALQAVTKEWRMIDHVPPEIKTVEFYAKALHKTSDAEIFIPRDVLRDPTLTPEQQYEMALKAVNITGKMIKYLPEELKTPQFFSDALRQNRDVRKFIPDRMLQTIQSRQSIQQTSTIARNPVTPFGRLSHLPNRTIVKFLGGKKRSKSRSKTMRSKSSKR
jgi:hypothetical protein